MAPQPMFLLPAEGLSFTLLTLSVYTTNVCDVMGYVRESLLRVSVIQRVLKVIEPFEYNVIIIVN